MADWAAVADDPILASSFTGRSAEAYAGSAQYTGNGLTVDDPSALSTTVIATDGRGVHSKDRFASTAYKAVVADFTTPGLDWFERFHVIPRSFNFGNIVSSQAVAIEVFSAFRHAVHSWTGFVNNAGAGVSLSGEPTLPHVMQPLSGVQMTLVVATNGPPRVDTFLEFVFDTGTTDVPISFQRVVLWNMPPELPYQEVLEFLTEVIEHKDGTEQRNSPRKCPRQQFQWEFMLDDGPERANLDNILFDWQTSTFGLPCWHELTRLSTAATTGDTAVNVQTTNYADYRINGLVLVWHAQTGFDILQLSSLTGTSLTFTDSLIGSYPAGTLVMPLRVGMVQGNPTGSRYRVNLGAFRISFQVTDNDVDLADVSAFSSFNSKVLLDDPNCVSGVLQEAFNRVNVVSDSQSGVIVQSSPWDRHRRGSSKTFLAKGRQAAWNTRRLMYALRGRQVSFYLPTFGEELRLTDPVVSGTHTLSVVNVGYAQFVRARQPRNVIRVVFKDSTITPVLRTVTSAVVIDATKESLTISSDWTTSFSVTDVLRIEYVEKVRLNSDQVVIQHALGDTSTRFTSPVVAVLE